MPRNKRGQAVQHTFRESPDIQEDSRRLHGLSTDQDELFDYAVKVTGPCVCSLILLVGFAVPLAMTAMGSYYFDECPAEPNIPVYLVVAGVTCFIYALGRYITAAQSRGYFIILSLFVICWFITGSVWIFSLYEPNYDESLNVPYCDKTLYLFAFWITIAEYIMCLITIVYLCILCLYREQIQ